MAPYLQVLGQLKQFLRIHTGRVCGNLEGNIETNVKTEQSQKSVTTGKVVALGNEF